MLIRCQDGSIEVSPDFADDSIALTVRDHTGREVTVTMSRKKALLIAVELDLAESNLAEHDE